mgnify:CR=1 FL=1
MRHKDHAKAGTDRIAKDQADLDYDLRKTAKKRASAEKSSAFSFSKLLKRVKRAKKNKKSIYKD